ncbi:hypothetical protein SNARM312S_04115 [Streptomyces narbonensis]
MVDAARLTGRLHRHDVAAHAEDAGVREGPAGAVEVDDERPEGRRALDDRLGDGPGQRAARFAAAELVADACGAGRLGEEARHVRAEGQEVAGGVSGGGHQRVAGKPHQRTA